MQYFTGPFGPIFPMQSTRFLEFNMSEHRFKLVKQMYLEHFDKLWGYVTLEVPGDRRLYRYKRKWAWWATTGKTINLKQLDHNFRNVEASKAKNGYVDITEEELLNKWPNFKEDLDSRLLYEILSNNE